MYLVVANKRVVTDFSKWTLKERGYPDGMSIDQDGKLWIAGFFSSKIMQFDPCTGRYRLIDTCNPCPNIS